MSELTLPSQSSPSNTNGKRQRLAIVASKGTLDNAYSPLILATTAVAMDMEAGIFFTFYGLGLLRKDISDLKVSPLGNPGMPMKMPFGPEGFQNINWAMPNLLMANVPGFESVATGLMKQTFKNKGVASVDELRQMCVELDVKMIGCQMTMDVMGVKQEDIIKGVEFGGAAMWLDAAADAQINLFI